jgi:hypothetical protein
MFKEYPSVTNIAFFNFRGSGHYMTELFFIMKESNMAYFKHYPTILIGGLGKTTKTLAAYFQTQIRKHDLLNTRIKPKTSHSTVRLSFKLNERNRIEGWMTQGRYEAILDRYELN